ncbi:hypothetical protein B0H19DRAFT_1273320 [Mycena capillaripes]|nr:hypothetical protein B0H19DRAFT_1273320 [Mycena capillaripes]
MVLFASFAAGFAFCGIFVQRANALRFPVPALSAPEITSAQIAMVQMAQTPMIQQKLSADVAAAARVAVGITQNFTNIGNLLQQIDNQNLQTAKFFPTWQSYSQIYDALLEEARTLAGSIANYADVFNEEVLVLVSDDSLPTILKLAVLQSFVNESTSFQNASSSLAVQFSELTSNITEFTGNFSHFAVNRTAADNQQIDNLMKEMGELMSEIKDIQDSASIESPSMMLMIALGAAMGATLLGSAIGLAFFPFAAPFIVIGAAVVEGLVAASEIGLATTIAIDENMVASLQGEVQILRNELSLINATQAELSRTASRDIPALTAQIGLFTAVWEDIASDCEKLIGWLNLSEPAVDMPDVLAVYLNQSTTIYSTMGNALAQYAALVPAMK